MKASKRYSNSVTGITVVSLLSMIASPVALASGFVKDKFYYKLSHAVVQRRPVNLGTAESSYKETTQRLGFYLESGLPLPWTAQISLSAGIKSIKRLSQSNSDISFESRGLTDSNLGFKSALYRGQLFQETSLPVYLSLAHEFTVTLPTSGRKFRTGSESQRYQDATPGYEFLVAPVSNGKWRVDNSIGLSLAAKGVWISQSVAASQDWIPASPARNLSTSVGVGLPGNSWVQLTGGDKKSTQTLTVDGLSNLVQTSESTWGAGLGVTVWNGLAIEANWDKTVPQGSGSGTSFTQWTFGLSYRDI